MVSRDSARIKIEMGQIETKGKNEKEKSSSRMT